MKKDEFIISVRYMYTKLFMSIKMQKNSPKCHKKSKKCIKMLFF